jgi:predicted transcriptional regulator
MADRPTKPIEAIGQCAGKVWSCLSKNGPTNITRLLRDLGLSRDLVFQAIGWLAREGKLTIEDTGRKKVVSLTGSKK